jgi:predicted nucleic acid-binding protein
VPVLDTTVLIDLNRRASALAARQAANLLRRLRDAGEPVMTTRLNVAEMYVGVALRPDLPDEADKLERLLAGLIVLELNDHAAKAYGQVTAYLRGTGRLIGDMDALIAAIAMVNGQSLVTRNARHFEAIPGLIVHGYE